MTCSETQARWGFGIAAQRNFSTSKVIIMTAHITTIQTDALTESVRAALLGDGAANQPVLILDIFGEFTNLDWRSQPSVPSPEILSFLRAMNEAADAAPTDIVFNR